MRKTINVTTYQVYEIEIAMTFSPLFSYHALIFSTSIMLFFPPIFVWLEQKHKRPKGAPLHWPSVPGGKCALWPIVELFNSFIGMQVDPLKRKRIILGFTVWSVLKDLAACTVVVPSRDNNLPLLKRAIENQSCYGFHPVFNWSFQCDNSLLELAVEVSPSLYNFFHELWTSIHDDCRRLQPESAQARI